MTFEQSLHERSSSAAQLYGETRQILTNRLVVSETNIFESEAKVGILHSSLILTSVDFHVRLVERDLRSLAGRLSLSSDLRRSVGSD